MRKLLDTNHAELSAVLDAMLRDDLDITVREVARRHPTLKNASAFTRNPARMTLIEQARERQRDARSIAQRDIPAKGKSLAQEVAKKTDEVRALEHQLRQLVAGHVALIRAVQLHGGMAGLERFWVDYKAVADNLQALGAIPEKAPVIRLVTSAHDT